MRYVWCVHAIERDKCEERKKTHNIIVNWRLHRMNQYNLDGKIKYMCVDVHLFGSAKMLILCVCFIWRCSVASLFRISYWHCWYYCLRIVWIRLTNILCVCNMRWHEREHEKEIGKKNWIFNCERLYSNDLEKMAKRKHRISQTYRWINLKCS